jgi:branched-chain amino acid transport system permease protein
MALLWANVVLSGVLMGLVYGLIALGLTIIFGVIRVVNFAHGAILVFGLYTGYWAGVWWGMPPIVGALLAGFLMFIVGYCLESLVVKRFVNRPYHAQFILFIGISLLLTGVQLIAFGPDPRPSVSQLSFETVSIGGVRLDLARLEAAAATTVLILTLAAFLKYSLFGRYIRAAADNRLGGLIVGIPIPKIYAITFGIGTACAGFAGALISPLFDAQPYLGIDFTLLAFVIVIVGGLGSFIGAMIGGLTNRGLTAIAAGVTMFIALAVLGAIFDSYLLSLLTIVFLFAFIGQSWSLMLGLGGQLSIGHALFVGIGAYSVAVLDIKYGLSPWLGLAMGAAIASAVGAALAWLSFRFEVRGIYFGLLTIAAAEFARVMFSGWNFVGGMQGLFFPAQSGDNSLLMLKGGARFYYFVALGAVAAGVGITAFIRASFLGYVWRAMRDDEDASRALGVKTFLHKVLVVSISGAWAAAGGGLLALVQGSIFPDSIMGMGISIDVLIGPIVGGLGTAFGPLIGALIIIPLDHLMSSLSDTIGLPGLNNVAYGLVLIAVVWLLPDGVWPVLIGRFRSQEEVRPLRSQVVQTLEVRQ